VDNASQTGRLAELGDIFVESADANNGRVRVPFSGRFCDNHLRPLAAPTQLISLFANNIIIPVSYSCGGAWHLNTGFRAGSVKGL